MGCWDLWLHWIPNSKPDTANRSKGKAGSNSPSNMVFIATETPVDAALVTFRLKQYHL